jgi:hypothetical protein
MKVKSYILFLFLFTILIKLEAQKNTITSGGTASGTGGEVNFTIGQIDYQTISNSNNKITQGLQQPIEIFVVLGIENKNIDISFSIFPNPTLNYLNLFVSVLDDLDFEYQIFDFKGALLDSQNITALQTKINLSDLNAGIYFLKIKKKKSEIKIYKIIKHD